MTNNTIEIEFDAYNQRRYSTPWAARVTYANGSRPSYEFKGVWHGTYHEGGIVSIDASDDAILAWGQKDQRGNGSVSNIGIVRDGKLVECTKVEAYKHAQALREAAATNPADTPIDAMRALLEQYIVDQYGRDSGPGAATLHAAFNEFASRVSYIASQIDEPMHSRSGC